jgi:hypothetical protein
MAHSAASTVVGTHAPQVIGIQRRSPRSDSTESWSNFDHHCVVNQLAVQVHGDRVELVLHQVGQEGQGVGLELPKDLAAVVGHFLLAAAHGDVDHASAELQPR